jgi:hypothetical protein
MHLIDNNNTVLVLRFIHAFLVFKVYPYELVSESETGKCMDKNWFIIFIMGREKHCHS